MESKPPEDEPLMTTEEVAHRLNVKSPTVYEAAADGRIPCVRLWQGSRRALIRFRREDVEAFIKARTSIAGERGES